MKKKEFYELVRTWSQKDVYESLLELIEEKRKGGISLLNG